MGMFMPVWVLDVPLSSKTGHWGVNLMQTLKSPCWLLLEDRQAFLIEETPQERLDIREVLGVIRLHGSRNQNPYKRGNTFKVMAHPRS